MLSFKLVLLLCYLSNYMLLAETEVKKITYACAPNVVDIDSAEPITKVTEYCNAKSNGLPCFAKCCRRGEILVKPKNDSMRCANSNTVNITWDTNLYKDITIYKPDIETQVQISDMNFLDFNFVQNKIFENTTCSEYTLSKNKNSIHIYALENGMMAKDTTAIGGVLSRKKPQHYCTDILYSELRNKKLHITFFTKEVGFEDPFTFYAVASIVSAVFLVLVFAVYCVLPQLRVLSGMLLMAYVATLFLVYTMKACLIYLANTERCKVMGPIFYFSYVSSFFWLNIMSFDIWWTFRAQRYQRAIHRQGIMVKFGWYCLYGWGVPLCMTIATILIDYYRDQITRKDLLPLYESCFNTASSFNYYMFYPTAIMTAANIVLFIMTVYNIWLINREINRFKASGGNTKKNKNRFRTYIKLSLLMGISWILEYAEKVYEDVENPLPVGGKIVMSLYNFLTGVIIFIMFILNKTTLRMLCKKFNIKFFQDLKINPSSRSTATKSSTHNGSYNHGKSTADSFTEVNETEISTDPRYEIKISK